ncbi:MAG TPA: hypothetical protein VKP30_33220, partial [Polyangiaceae bacterium]|nr:hypothetical protein [Polyangiaceae bacterium]
MIRPASYSVVGIAFSVGLACATACRGSRNSASDAGGASTASAAAAPLSTLHVDHGDLDTKAPQGAPELAAL